MNRRSFRKTLVERGVYGSGRSAKSVETLLEVQYLIAKSLVTRIIKSGKTLNHELVNESYEQIIGRRHTTAAAERDSFASINAQALPEVKSIHGPPSGEAFKYEAASKLPETTTMSKATTVIPIVSDESEEPVFHAKKASNQVVFGNNSAPADEDDDEDFAKQFMDDSDEEDASRKRQKLDE